MRRFSQVIFGWIVPGGAALVEKRYTRFAVVFVAVTLSVVAGIALGGASEMPGSGELQGLDGVSMLMARAGGVIRYVAGAPLLIANALGYSHSFLDGRLHEQGTTLLLVAGLFNLLALVDPLGERETS